MSALRSAAQAIADPSPARTTAVLATFERLAGEGQDYAVQAVWIAVYLGQPDAAMAFADRLLDPDRVAGVTRRFDDHVEYAIARERPTAMLFVPPADRLWTHPRFLPLMERAGLVGYWRDHGGPDLCHRAELRAACRQRGILPR